MKLFRGLITAMMLLTALRALAGVEEDVHNFQCRMVV
jgi:hypothetical protein